MRVLRGSCALVGVATLVLLSSLACALNNGASPNPIRGISTWCVDSSPSMFSDNCGADICNETMIQTMAQGLIHSGMKEAGYDLVLLDDCWAGPSRDSEGNLQANVTEFPNGMKPVVDYVHSLGLKLGLYTCAGKYVCTGKSPGSLDHYDQDMALFASWGVDYVKMDWCYSGLRLPEVQYHELEVAQNKTGRTMWLEMCEWGILYPWTFGRSRANSARTTTDHHDQWSGSAHGTKEIIEHSAFYEVWKFSGCDGSDCFWNYLDVLMTGLGDQTSTEYQTEFSFWAFLNSPLIVASDVRNMSDLQRTILLNEDLLNINHDPLHEEGHRLYKISEDLEVWGRNLFNGDVAVILFNKGDDPTQDLTVDFSRAFGWPANQPALVRDCWGLVDLGLFKGSFTWKGVTPPHGVRVLRISKQ